MGVLREVPSHWQEPRGGAWEFHFFKVLILRRRRADRTRSHVMPNAPVDEAIPLERLPGAHREH